MFARRVKEEVEIEYKSNFLAIYFMFLGHKVKVTNAADRTAWRVVAQPVWPATRMKNPNNISALHPAEYAESTT